MKTIEMFDGEIIIRLDKDSKRLNIWFDDAAVMLFDKDQVQTLITNLVLAQSYLKDEKTGVTE